MNEKKSLGRAWLFLTIATVAATLALCWWWLVHGDLGRFTTRKGVDEFWKVVAAAAPTLAIAYAVTISDAVRTYQDLRDAPPPADTTRQRRKALAFFGGAVGSFFVLLQAIVAWIALRSVLGESSYGSPVNVAVAEATTLAFVAVVPLLAHAWAWPWSPESSPAEPAKKA